MCRAVRICCLVEPLVEPTEYLGMFAAGARIVLHLRRDVLFEIQE